MAEARVSQAGVTVELEQATPGVEVFQAGMLVEAGFEGVGVTKLGVIVEIGTDALHVTKLGVLIEMDLKELPVATFFPDYNAGPRPHRILPEPVLGYQLDEEGSFWTIVTPQASENVAQNGSFESALTDNLVEVGSLTASFDYTKASRGFRSRRYTTAGLAGGVRQFFTIPGPGYVAWSFDIYSQYDISLILRVFEGNPPDEEIVTTTVPITGGGWKRYSLIYYDPDTQADKFRWVMLRTIEDSVYDFNTDGWQVEFSEQPTTYFDGDSQEFSYDSDPYAYAWKSIRYVSPSIRSARTYNGGKEVSLEDYGFRTTSIVGLGMGDTTLDIATLASGEEILKNAFVGGKEFSIVGKVFGKNEQEVQYKRQGLINLLNTLNSRSGMVMLGYQPVDRRGRPYGKKLWVYATFLGGLAMSYTNLYQETLELRFRVFNSRLFEEFGSVSQLEVGGAPDNDTTIYARDPNTGEINPYLVGTNSTVGGSVKCAVIMDDGSLLVGGSFTAIGGVAALRTARFNPATQAWEEYAGGFNDGTVEALAIGRGHLEGLPIAVGSFTTLGDGVTAAARAAYYDDVNDVWTQFGLGLDATVRDVDVAPSGEVLIGGEFTETASGSVPMFKVAWANATVSGASTAWQAIATSGTGDVFCVKIGPDEVFYFGGDFTALNTDAAANGIASFIVGSGFLTPLSEGLNDAVWDIEFGPDGYLYCVGEFTEDFQEERTLRHFARWTGREFEEVGRGEVNQNFYFLAWDRRGYAYISGAQGVDGDYDTSGSVGFTSLYQWTGSTWVSPDIRLIKISAPSTGRLLVTADGELIVPTFAATNLSVAGHTEINYQGTADAPVKLKVVGPCVLHKLSNWTVNKHVYFKSVNLSAGEEFYLDLTGLFPIAFTNFRTNLLDDIVISVSDVDSFRLTPGVNNITIVLSGTFDGNTAASLQWNNHHWSIDIASQ